MEIGDEMAGGRPSIYSEELASDICAHLMNGLSMMDIERLDGMPTRQKMLTFQHVLRAPARCKAILSLTT